MLETINKAISNYEQRLQNAICAAANQEDMPGVGVIRLLKNDLDALLLMRRDEEQRLALAVKLAEIDAA